MKPLAWFALGVLLGMLTRYVWRRRARRRARPPALAPGMTLAPGESATFAIPPELSAHLSACARAGSKIEYRNGPIISTGSDRFSRLVYIEVDGEPIANFEVGWSGDADIEGDLEVGHP